jgi:hypothetical protein
MTCSLHGIPPDSSSIVGPGRRSVDDTACTALADSCRALSKPSCAPATAVWRPDEGSSATKDNERERRDSSATTLGTRPRRLGRRPQRRGRCTATDQRHASASGTPCSGPPHQARGWQATTPTLRSSRRGLWRSRRPRVSSQGSRACSASAYALAGRCGTHSGHSVCGFSHMDALTIVAPHRAKNRPSRDVAKTRSLTRWSQPSGAVTRRESLRESRSSGMSLLLLHIAGSHN